MKPADARTTAGAAWPLVLAACVSTSASCVWRPSPEYQGWIVEYSRHGGIQGWSLDMTLRDDGRTRAKVRRQNPTDGTASAARVAEISALLARMLQSRDLVPARWKWFDDDCGWWRRVADCQHLEVTVRYRGSSYDAPRVTPLFADLLTSLVEVALEVENGVDRDAGAEAAP